MSKERFTIHLLRGLLRGLLTGSIDTKALAILKNEQIDLNDESTVVKLTAALVNGADTRQIRELVKPVQTKPSDGWFEPLVVDRDPPTGDWFED